MTLINFSINSGKVFSPQYTGTITDMVGLSLLMIEPILAPVSERLTPSGIENYPTATAFPAAGCAMLLWCWLM
jgi:hypothetical protein